MGLRQRWSVLPASVAVLLVASACGQSSGTAAPSNSPSSAPVASPTSSLSNALFYARNGSLFVSDPAGTPGRQLTNGSHDGEPAPSPDAKQLAFIRRAASQDKGGEVWIVASDGQSAHRLVDPAKLQNQAGNGVSVGALMPRWSPVGDRIAFLAKAPTAPGGSLMTADPRTGAVSPVANGYASRFAWSPDGTSLAWIAGSAGAQPVNIYFALVSENAATAVVKAAFPADLTFAPGGQRLVFSNLQAPASVPGSVVSLPKAGLYTVAVAGGGPVAILTPTPANAAATAYMFLHVVERGGQVAFAERVPPGEYDIQLTPLAGGAVVDLMPHVLASDDDPVAWSAGDSAAFLLAGTSRPTLTVIKADGSGKASVDTGVSSFGWPPRAR